MNILGINGLGINPAACLWQAGKLTALAAEERFTRQKESVGMMPVGAAAWCLQQAKISLEQIDAIAFGWYAPRYQFYMPFFVAKTALQYASFNSDKGAFKNALEQLAKYRPDAVRSALGKMCKAIDANVKVPPVYFYRHHLAHAASAYFASGMEQAHIIVVDGSGEDKCTTIFSAQGEEITQVETMQIPHSLGWFYQSITEWLGFTPNSHEGKTMALAAYGKYDADTMFKLQQMLSIDTDGAYSYNPRFSFAGKHTTGSVYSTKLEALLGKARAADSALLPYHYNVAYAAQSLIESAMLGLLKRVTKLPNFNGNICLAGGVALNCKMNGILAAHPAVKNVFVPPVSSDDGTALGAAMLHAKAMGINHRLSMQHAYYGPSFSDKEIEQALRQTTMPFSLEPCIEKTAASALAQGKIIGWFQGAMEAGARALGNRSILAHPAIEGMSNKVNLQVKNREAWRPFAASILCDAKDRLLLHAQHAPFMTIAFSTTAEAQQLIPEAIHTDGTTRPQLVTPEANYLYHRLISEFEKQTGIPALLNTSFNDKEEPIVCTPEQAVKTFLSTGLDALAIGNYWLQKDNT